MVEPRIQYVASADGVQIACTTIGEGLPLVFAASVFGDIAMAGSDPTATASMLARDGFRVTLYDGRGTGSSDRGVSDVSFAARLADIEAVVDRMAPEHFALVGTVHGAPVAVAYAAKHPDRVSRLALSASYARGVEYYSATPMSRAIKGLLEMAEDHWDFFTLTLANWILGFRDPAQAERMASRYRDGMSARDYLAQVAAIEITDISDLLPRIQTPTLIVRDRSSPFSAPELTRRVAAAIPGAQAVTVDSPAAMGAAILSFLKGEEPSARPVSAASSVVTVLFTDVVGHTEMMRRLGDAKGREVLREHERITREVLAQHAGTEVKTMGDGFMASFGSVTKAVECAISLQKAFTDRNHVGGLDRGVGVEQLQHDAPNSDEGVAVAQPLRASEPAPTSVEPLNVRVGLNAGEPIEDAGDLFGSSVILASRIAAKANGGEIFASMAVRELCTGKGFLFADLGDHELRGFEDPVRVFEVKWRDHA